MRRVSIALILLLAACTAAPVPSSPTRPYVFLQLSDPQFGMFTADHDFAQETVNFERAVTHVNRLRPDFVVITGDLVNRPGDVAQMDEYDRIRGLIDSAIPVYDMPGNHDVANAPTPERLAAYRERYTRDRYVFRHKNLFGIVLNSSLIHTPDQAPADAAAQEAWLRTELANAGSSGARHIVVFQHHPWFLRSATEPDEYFNIPLARRVPLLALLRDAGVRTLVSGHYHRNAEASDGGFDAIVTGAVGMPLGESRSGFRIFRVTDEAIAHRYIELDTAPDAIDPDKEL
jgi:3',5'-cyclic AMP phosphodiesterase CpdA